MIEGSFCIPKSNKLEGTSNYGVMKIKMTMTLKEKK